MNYLIQGQNKIRKVFRNYLLNNVLPFFFFRWKMPPSTFDPRAVDGCWGATGVDAPALVLAALMPSFSHTAWR